MESKIKILYGHFYETKVIEEKLQTAINEGFFIVKTIMHPTDEMIMFIMLKHEITEWEKHLTNNISYSSTLGEHIDLTIFEDENLKDTIKKYTEGDSDEK